MPATATGLDDMLTNKVGGVPVWAIAASGAAVVIGGAYFLNSRRADQSGVTVYSPEDFQPEPGDLTNADFGLPEGPIGDFLRENPGYPGYPVGGGSGGLPSPITNAQWARMVIDRLLGESFDPALVTNAITKYIAGLGLNPNEKAIVQQALQRFGTTPEGALQIIDAPAGGGTGTPSNTAPPAPNPVTVSISSVTGIATIRWKHSEGATSYIVYGGPSGSGVTSSRVITNHLTHTYLWTGMQKGKSYSFSVAARNANGYNISSVVSAKRN